MVRIVLPLVATLLMLSAVVGQSSGSATLPCDYSAPLLQDANGTVVRYTSDEMKSRAFHKTDVGDFMRRVDIKGAIVFDVLVGTQGEVVCTKSLVGHPLIRHEVEAALRTWRFRPATRNGIPVSYLGRLQFVLCNILCGETGVQMSILK